MKEQTAHVQWPDVQAIECPGVLPHGVSRQQRYDARLPRGGGQGALHDDRLLRQSLLAPLGRAGRGAGAGGGPCGGGRADWRFGGEPYFYLRRNRGQQPRDPRRRSRPAETGTARRHHRGRASVGLDCVRRAGGAGLRGDEALSGSGRRPVCRTAGGSLSGGYGAGERDDGQQRDRRTVSG